MPPASSYDAISILTLTSAWTSILSSTLPRRRYPWTSSCRGSGGMSTSILTQSLRFRRILLLPFCHGCRLHRCLRHCRRRCTCSNLDRLLRYCPLIYPPPFSDTSVRTSLAVPTVVPLPPLSVGVAAYMTTAAIGAVADPDARNLADPAVVRSFRWVGRSLSSSSFYPFSSSLSSSSSYPSPSTAAFVILIVVPEEG